MSDGESQLELDSKPQLPTGEARKLDELTSEKWREHLLLFSQVKNKVLIVNPNVHVPLQLEEGKQSPLGLLAEVAFREKPAELPKGKHALEVWPKTHGRSALLGRIIFKDNKNKLYRDIDLKGIGLISSSSQNTVEIGPLGIENPQGGRWGLLDYNSALYDYKMSEKFIGAGIRTPRVLAIIEVSEVISRGVKFSLKEVVELGFIDKTFRPVVEVRAFGTKARVGDCYLNQEDGVLLLEDAKKLVAQELGKEPMSDNEYLTWFAQTLGLTVAIMHKNGWQHNYLSPHNITLDCRIVDLDSIKPLDSETKQIKDFKDAKDSLFLFLSWLSLIGRVKDEKPLLAQFQESYDAVFSPKERKGYFRKLK